MFYVDHHYMSIDYINIGSIYWATKAGDVWCNKAARALNSLFFVLNFSSMCFLSPLKRCCAALKFPVKKAIPMIFQTNIIYSKFEYLRQV